MKRMIIKLTNKMQGIKLKYEILNMNKRKVKFLLCIYIYGNEIYLLIKFFVVYITFFRDKLISALNM